MFSLRWTLVMRATLKQMHSQNPSKKHRLLRRGLHKELSKTLKRPRIHLPRELYHKGRPEAGRRAPPCLKSALLRTTRLSRQLRQEEGEPGGTWAGRKEIRWKSQTKWGPLMKNSQRFWTSVSNSWGHQMPKTTLPQLIIWVRMFLFKKNHTEIRSRKLSLSFRLFGVCVCLPKVTCCLKVLDKC